MFTTEEKYALVEIIRLGKKKKKIKMCNTDGMKRVINTVIQKGRVSENYVW